MFPSISSFDVPNTLIACKSQMTLQNNVISEYDDYSAYLWNRKKYIPRNKGENKDLASHQSSMIFKP